MTAPKSALRPRRHTAGNGIPKDTAAWFAGERVGERSDWAPWSALLSPGYELLREHWQTWVAEHPGATPPAGYEWIAEPPPERRHGHPYAEVVATARKILARRRK